MSWTNGLPTGYLDESDRDYGRPRIRGDRAFKRWITEALDWLEANSLPHYRFTCLWLNSITETQTMPEARAWVFTSSGKCHFDPGIAASDSARSIAGTLVHEAMHVYLRKRLSNRLESQEEEDICERAKAAAIGNSGYGDYSSYGANVIVVRI